MPTYKELLNCLTNKFKEAGIHEFESDAWLLFEEAYSLSRSDYIIRMNDTAPENPALEGFANRRLEGVPVQYITGKAYFMGYTFNVDENVLIPRFDTEIIVDAVYRRCTQNAAILDMCTGSGCIIISLAKLLNDGVYVGADISGKALTVAFKNAEALKARNTTFIQSDMFENVTGKYDVIVSNPPYIRTEVIDTLDREVKGFEPHLALDGGADGLDFYRILSDNAKNFLNEKGILAVEIGFDQGKSVSELFNETGFENVEIIKDLAGLDRVVIGNIGGK